MNALFQTFLPRSSNNAKMHASDRFSSCGFTERNVIVVRHWDSRDRVILDVVPTESFSEIQREKNVVSLAKLSYKITELAW